MESWSLIEVLAEKCIIIPLGQIKVELIAMSYLEHITIYRRHKFHSRWWFKFILKGLLYSVLKNSILLSIRILRGVVLGALADTKI